MARSLKKPDEIYHIWDSYRSEREQWAVEAANDEDFYFGNQWTSADAKKLAEKGMAPLVINRVMPVIQQEMTMFLGRQPRFRYVAAEDSDVAKAGIFGGISDHVWAISNGDLQIASAMQDYFVMGAGYMMAHIDRYADEGRGEVKVRHVPVWDVYPDPNSRLIDLSDARHIFISRSIDRDGLIYMYPDKAAAIRRVDIDEAYVSDRPESGTYKNGTVSPADISYDEPGGAYGKIRAIESYSKIMVPLLKLVDTRTGVTMIVDPKKFDKKSASPSVRAIELYEPRIQVSVTAGKSVKLDEYMLPMDIYPIVSLYLHHSGTPFPVGDVRMVKGLQQEINKRRSIMIHNAAASSNTRWLAEKGTIPNKAEWERSGNTPGAVLEYVRSMQGDKPEMLLPGQLPSAWIQLEQEAQNNLEYTLSVFAHQMGSAQDAPETYRGMLALDEKGKQKLNFKATHARIGLRNLGKIILRLAQLTYTTPKVIRVVGEESGPVKEFFLNKPHIDPLTNRVVKINDVTIGNYDVIVEDGMSMPTNRQAQLQQMQELYQLGVVDKVEVLKKTSIPDREAVIQRMGEIQQLSGQVQQLQEAMKNIEGLNQTLRRELQQREIQLGVEKEMTKVRRYHASDHC